MSKTIQVRVDDHLKDSADLLFASLGLDTSTAIRMFLMASMEAGGIPFAVMRREDRDAAIIEAIARRKAGERFYTAEEFMAHMETAVLEGGKNAVI